MPETVDDALSPDGSPDGSPDDLAEPPSVVFKFGGTSVGSPERFETVVRIVREASDGGRVVAVVSALSRVTRQLSAALEAFTTQDGADPKARADVVDALIDTLRTRHVDQAREVLSLSSRKAYEAVLDQRLRQLRGVFARVEREGFSASARDAVLATGEQLSVPMVTCALRDAGLNAPHVDATALVVTDDTFGEANVLRDDTVRRVRDWYASLSPRAVPVVAGFIGATAGGQTTTLGFEGSDYSAALVTQILGAGCLTRYTDIDALYTDDPQTNADAKRLDVLPMEKAYAMTESGRLGMHPKTLRPLVEAGIPMQVRCIDAPSAPGTRILPDGVDEARLVPVVTSTMG